MQKEIEEFYYDAAVINSCVELVDENDEVECSEIYRYYYESGKRNKINKIKKKSSCN